jgi:hydroxymethylbilane synthase
VRSDSEAVAAVSAVDHEPSRHCVAAERAFLGEIDAGCHVPAGALAEHRGSSLSLRACLFSEDHTSCAEGQEHGTDPAAVGVALARRLLQELQLKG